MTWSIPYPAFAGRYLGDIAAEWGLEPEAAAHRLLPAGAIYFQLDEGNVRDILAYPHTMIGSDGLPHDVHPHPRLWGSFVRVLEHYVREVGLMSCDLGRRRLDRRPSRAGPAPRPGEGDHHPGSVSRILTRPARA